MNRWMETKLTLQSLVEDVLPGYKREGIDFRKLANKKKHQFDAERLEKFPSTEQIKDAVLNAMVSLGSLSRDSAGKDQLDFSEKLNATTAMVGIIYYNSFAGRSGEWQIMTRAHMEEQAAASKDFLLCPEHKTNDTYGTLAKYVPAGSMEAMKVYCNLPGKTTDLLLEPASPQSLNVSVHQHLKKFGRMFLNEPEPPNSNLIRKQYHTMLLRLSREGGAMELMRKVDAHSVDVAMKVYATTTNEDDAKLGKYLHEHLFGEPVNWPSEDMIRVGGPHGHAPDLSQQYQIVAVPDQSGSSGAFTIESIEQDEGEEEEEEHDFILTTHEVEDQHAEVSLTIVKAYL